MWPLLRLIAALVFPFTLACTASAARPVVVTTHTVLADIARELAGDSAEVHCLVPLGADPHSFEPKPADVRRLAGADLVIENGLGLEPWSGRMLVSSGYAGAVLRAAENLPHPLEAAHHDHGHDGHDHGEETLDPHAWHDPRNGEHYVNGIARALTERLPEAADTIEIRRQRYVASLRALHAAATTALAALPEEARTLVTSHDALGYFARAYGLRLVPISGLSPDREPSARQLARVVTRIRRERVRAVFFEATTNPKLTELVAREAGVTVVRQLYTDSLGLPGTPGATYLGMMQANVDTLLSALR